MKTQENLRIYKSDPAAIFATANSLWNECLHEATCKPDLNLSESYGGIDELMRQVMRVATLFESWSCRHVSFDELTDVWPYLLEDKFGRACFYRFGLNKLSDFNDHDCRQIAERLGLALR